jgi:hypothetical protein
MSRKSKEAERHMYDLGRSTWHCSEEGGGPDVGISLGLGDGRMLWCGEIARDRWDEAGEDAKALGTDFGWWIILYSPDSAEVIGKCVSGEAAQRLMEQLAAAFKVVA